MTLGQQLWQLKEWIVDTVSSLSFSPARTTGAGSSVRRSAFRVIAVAFWALTTARLISSYTGPEIHVHYLSVWVISAAGYLFGVLFWSLPWLRLPVDQLFGAIVIGIALPLLYLSFVGNLHSRDVLSVYIAAAVFTAALLPLRTAMAAALLGAVAAAIPLLAGWTTYYDRSLLVLISVIGLLTYLQARTMGSLGQEKREVEDRHRQMEASYMATVGALAASIFAKDRSAEAHSRGTATLAVAVARRLGLKGEALRLLEYAALLHDVGKVGLPGYLLNKPEPLTDDELAGIREHPVIAERILSSVPALAPVCPIIRAQYERWNGSGYPDGLAGEAIPLGARILHACAAFHAMISDRPYRPAIGEEEALAQLQAEANKQFDPRVVEALAAVIKAREVQMVTDPSPGSGEAVSAQRYWMQQLETIEGLGSRLGLETGEQAACRLVGEAIVSLIPYDQCRILMLAKDGIQLIPVFLLSTDREEYTGVTVETLTAKVGEGIAGWVAETKRGVVIGDSEQHPMASHIAGTPFVRESLIAAPALFKGQFLGLIVVVKLGANQYSRDHLRLLRIMANQLAASIVNARLVERLDDGSQSDSPRAA